MKSIIRLDSIFADLCQNNCKIHFARRSTRGDEPLNDYLSDFENWKQWNRYSNTRNDFNRDYIFSLISFYPEVNTWLFGGLWKVVSRDMSKTPYPYEIDLVEKYSEYIGRLKIKYEYKKRATRVCCAIHFGKMVVKEILEEPFSTIFFPGYKNIDLPFKTLESIINKDSTAWKNALSIKGIYLITDIETGKKYVGKAGGEHGVWQRWSDYIRDGHGGDVDLRNLVERNGFEYVRKNYKFSLLETVIGWDENSIDDREIFWKRVLMSRNEDFGHNKN